MPIPLAFKAWKELFRNDCMVQDKLVAFNALGDTVLRLFYESGLDPTVESVVVNGLNGKPKATHY